MRVHIVCEKHLSVRARRKSWSARLWVSCAELAELSLTPSGASRRADAGADGKLFKQHEGRFAKTTLPHEP